MKKNLAVILAFTLPIALLLIVAGSIYLPGLFIKTDYDFVYATCSSRQYYYDCQYDLPQRLSVRDGVLSFNPPAPDVKEEYPRQKIVEVSDIRFFRHDTEKNESNEITFDEVRKFTLDPLTTSPDGVTFVGGSEYYNGDFFFIFGGRSEYGYYLSKGRNKSKLYLVTNGDRYYYDRNIHFIGWIK